jgi:hypothetical protein
MTRIFVTYDIHFGYPQNYQNLIKAIKAYPNAIEPLKSFWIINSKDNCNDVATALWQHMKPDDKLFVGLLPKGAAWRGTADEADTHIIAMSDR